MGINRHSCADSGYIHPTVVHAARMVKDAFSSLGVKNVRPIENLKATEDKPDASQQTKCDCDSSGPMELISQMIKEQHERHYAISVSVVPVVWRKSKPPLNVQREQQQGDDKHSISKCRTPLFWWLSKAGSNIHRVKRPNDLTFSRKPRSDGVVHAWRHLVLLPARIMANLNLPDKATDSCR